MSEVVNDFERRVLFMAPTPRDGEITRSLLARARLACSMCSSLRELANETARGAGVLLLTEEALNGEGISDLLHVLGAQPPWSDLPVVLLMPGGSQSEVAARAVRELGNVTLLERPASIRSLVSAVSSAIRARERQYQTRAQLLAVQRAESRARELQQQLEIAIDASQLGTFHCEMPLGRIVWNDQCKAHFWLPPDAEIDFDLFYSILHPDDRERTRAAVEACVQRGEKYDIEYRTVSPTGQIRWVRATGRTYFDDKNRPVRFDGTTRDVTEQRQRAQEREELLESERAARTEAEKAGRMKDEFLATLSHELRTPLNAILGWSQMIHQGVDAQTLQEGLTVIERNARVQVQLIEDLLDMSRIISGKVRLDVQHLDPESFIDAAIETVTPAAQAKEIRLHKVLSRSGPIMGDPGRLQQIVWNLLSNAIKFTPKGGRVEVLLEKVNSHIEISVSDTGKGIKPDFLPHVFERFRQADASTTRQHGGLGLGLAIVKHLVELHGGTIQAKSEGENKGSTFTVSLPVAVAQWETKKKTNERAAAGSSEEKARGRKVASLKGVRVLVVDDEPDARDLIRRLLEDCDAKVTTAGSAADALKILDAETPHVLVSDIGMPLVDGYDLMKQVRSRGATRGGNVPAIALSAFARSEDRTRALMAGYSVHVSKPVEPRELVATVASIAGRTGAAVEASS
jgi:signal transduction histidine kinase/CheY-like chemotaxis protein